MKLSKPYPLGGSSASALESPEGRADRGTDVRPQIVGRGPGFVRFNVGRRGPGFIRLPQRDRGPGFIRRLKPRTVSGRLSPVPASRGHEARAAGLHEPLMTGRALAS